jgi:hypothetical protein
MERDDMAARKRKVTTVTGTTVTGTAATPAVVERDAATDPLDVVAGQINALFEKSDDALKESDDKRISAGLLLVQAKARVQAREDGINMPWKVWLKTNIKRSYQDVCKVVAIASAPDPQKALKDERAKAREGMKATRAKAAQSKAEGATKTKTAANDEPIVQIDDLDRAIAAVKKLGTDDLAEFVKWLNGDYLPSRAEVDEAA